MVTFTDIELADIVRPLFKGFQTAGWGARYNESQMLAFGMAAYRLALSHMEGRVPIPTNVAMAEMMEKFGFEYLNRNAPEMLTDEGRKHGDSVIAYAVIVDLPTKNADAIKLDGGLLAVAPQQGRLTHQLHIYKEEKCWNCLDFERVIPVEIRPLKIDKTEPIPTGIYYMPEHDNFYNENTNKGQGQDFYLKWRPRAMEFPTLVLSNV